MSAFPDITKIRYEGPESKNPLAFRHYDENEFVVAARSRSSPYAKDPVASGTTE